MHLQTHPQPQMNTSDSQLPSSTSISPSNLTDAPGIHQCMLSAIKAYNSCVDTIFRDTGPPSVTMTVTGMCVPTCDDKHHRDACVPHTTHSTPTCDHDTAGNPMSQKNSVGYQMRKIQDKTRTNKQTETTKTAEKAKTKRRRV